MNAYRSKIREYYLAYTNYYTLPPTIVEYEQFKEQQLQDFDGFSIETSYNGMNDAIASPSTSFGG